MGKKLLCLIMAMCCVFGLISCGEEKIAADKATTDSTLHGGFVAETDKYVYFINGIESYSTAYKTGEVTKGALLRVEKNNLSATPETVVSKLLVAGDYSAGIYLHGEYVYYAVASTDNDKAGNVKSDKLTFLRTKLDASETSNNIADRDFANSATYRYVTSGNNVYLVVHSTDLFVYDAINGGLVYTTEVNAEDKAYKNDETALNDAKLHKLDVSEVVFAKDNVYFTVNPVNTLLSTPDNIQKDSFHNVYTIDFANKKAVEVVSGAGTKLVDGSANPNGGFTLLGVTIDLLRVDNGVLYFSYTSLNTVEASKPVYMAIATNALTAASANTWHKTAAYSETTNNTASIFANTSIFHGGKVYYVQADIGLLVYDHAKKADANTDKGVSVLLSSELLKGATLDFVNVEDGKTFLYFHDASNIYYKVNLAEDAGKLADKTVLRINTYAINSTWYKPEVVKRGNDFYLIAPYTDAAFKSYVYAINMKDLKAEDDASWEDLDTTIDSKLAFEKLAKDNNLLGLIADTDKEVDEE